VANLINRQFLEINLFYSRATKTQKKKNKRKTNHLTCFVFKARPILIASCMSVINPFLWSLRRSSSFSSMASFTFFRLRNWTRDSSDLWCWYSCSSRNNSIKLKMCGCTGNWHLSRRLRPSTWLFVHASSCIDENCNWVQVDRASKMWIIAFFREEKMWVVYYIHY